MCQPSQRLLTAIDKVWKVGMRRET